MEINPKYICSEVYHGKPGQAAEIIPMIAAHQDPNACLEWPYKLRKLGRYGVVRHAGWDWRVHRLAYKIVHGSIPDDKVVMHSCDNPPCFNPNHLSIGTRTDNAADRHKKGRTTGPRVPWTGPRGPRVDMTGANNRNAKLTESKVREIWDRRSIGHTQQAIADAIGVTQGTVSHVLKGRVWKHVSPLLSI